MFIMFRWTTHTQNDYFYQKYKRVCKVKHRCSASWFITTVTASRSTVCSASWTLLLNDSARVWSNPCTNVTFCTSLSLRAPVTKSTCFSGIHNNSRCRSRSACCHNISCSWSCSCSSWSCSWSSRSWSWSGSSCSSPLPPGDIAWCICWFADFGSSSFHLSIDLLLAFMKKLPTVVGSRPSCLAIVTCISFDGRFVSCNIHEPNTIDQYACYCGDVISSHSPFGHWTNQ